MMQNGHRTKLRIGELAKQLELNPKTIRYYEEIGLMPKPPRTEAGYRLYDAADRERLSFIGKAKAIGLTLEDIREILTIRGDGAPPCEHVSALLDKKLSAIEAQLRALRTFRKDLLTLREAASEAATDQTGVCRIIEHSQPAHSRQIAPAHNLARPAP
jgi:MerR family transcriptional regulator, Zn(II)-responsive regulator of zntA